MPAVVWLCGPPCRPGKTALSIAVACSAVDMSIRRAGRAASCAWWSRSRRRARPATGARRRRSSPAMCAMSATSTAPTSRAISAKAGKSMVRGMAVPPQKISFGRWARARSRTSSMSTRPVSRPTPYCDGAEPLAGGRDRPAVGEVPAHRQRHAHHGVAGLGEGQVDGQVGGRAGVRLDVGVVDAEERLRAVDGERLDLVDVLLALVVALARVPLGVLVREHGAGRLEHRGRDVVLRRWRAMRWTRRISTSWSRRPGTPAKAGWRRCATSQRKPAAG